MELGEGLDYILTRLKDKTFAKSVIFVDQLVLSKIVTPLTSSFSFDPSVRALPWSREWYLLTATSEVAQGFVFQLIISRHASYGMRRWQHVP